MQNVKVFAHCGFFRCGECRETTNLIELCDFINLCFQVTVVWQALSHLPTAWFSRNVAGHDANDRKRFALDNVFSAAFISRGLSENSRGSIEMNFGEFPSADLASRCRAVSSSGQDRVRLPRNHQQNAIR